jgi:hypothetical protein
LYKYDTLFCYFYAGYCRNCRFHPYFKNEIKNLRLEGHLIGSNNKGYFKIIDEEDYKVTINHLSSRIKETQTIIACLQENFQNRENG